MKKSMRVGGVSLDIPDHTPQIGELITALQNMYERGELRSILVVTTSDTRTQASVVGNPVHLAMLGVVASELSSNLLDSIVSGVDSGDGDD